MFARLTKFVPKAVTNNADFKVAKNLLCDITGQLPKLAAWGAPLGLLGKINLRIDFELHSRY